MSIQTIRQQFRQTRRDLSPLEQTQHALLLQQNLQSFIGFKHALNIGAYIATQGEISLNPWIAHAKRQHIFAPKLYEPLEPRLRFAALDANTRWERNRFNILEPAAHWGQTLHPRLLDIVLTPLVAFDRKGYRLGMGGGYYDRSLAFRCARKHWQRPLLVGVAHSCQQHPELPRQPWDVPLDIIITEREIIRCNNSAAI
jgi:5-formyltetrahydrofolate cyclo-ligase